MMLVRKVVLPLEGLETLVAEAQAEGFRFLDCLIEDWASRKLRFSGRGEALFGIFSADGGVETLVAVGGLTLDPFAGREDTGRLRRIYVRREWRRQGIGEMLVRTMLDEAGKVFPRVRLQAENPEAARLYERLGFVPIEDDDATHLLVFDQAVAEDAPLH